MTAASWTSALWFVAVLALIPIALWLLKRSPVGSGASQGAGLRNVASLALSPTQRIVTVEVGHGDDRRWLVLGVTQSNINTLYSVAPFDDAPAAGAPSSGFSLMLGKLRNGPATAEAAGNGNGNGKSALNGKANGIGRGAGPNGG